MKLSSARLRTFTLVLFALAACASHATPVPTPTRTSPPRSPTVTQTATSTAILLAMPIAINANTIPFLTQVGRVGLGQVSVDYNNNFPAFSPDGQTLAVPSSVGVILLDANTLEPKRTLETSQWMICAAFSPDGQWLAAGGQEGLLQVWNAKISPRAYTLTVDMPAETGLISWTLSIWKNETGRVS